MRVAIIFALILMVATPSEASESCMSVTEARQHFGLVHIYWHGADHCWDASPGRRQRHITHTVASKPDEPKWRDAMSEMVPDANVAQILWLDRWVDIKSSELPLVARWGDIPRATSQPIAEPTTTSLTVMLLFALLVIALPRATIALLQGTIYRRRRVSMPADRASSATVSSTLDRRSSTT
jgi:hypothetical protein